MNKVSVDILDEKEREAYYRILDWKSNFYFPGMCVGSLSNLSGLIALPISALQKDLDLLNFGYKTFIGGVSLMIFYHCIDVAVSRLNGYDGLVKKLSASSK